MYNEIYLPRSDDFSENYNPNQSNITIDEDDLYIIKNPEEFDPPDEIVFAYARKLGFDIINDPPELLEIAKKYLMVPLRPNMERSFLKENLQILYINELTGDIFRDNEVDLECRKEYEKEKEKLMGEKKNKKNKKKGKKKKNKKANNNKDNKDININNNEEDKKKILDKKKLKLKEYKEKMKLKYLENKTKVIKKINDEYDIKIYSGKNKIKNDLENDIIKPLEIKLKQEYDNTIQKYKQELKEKYEQNFSKENINLENNDEINELNDKIKILQNQILKQKEKKEEKIREEKIKIEKDLNIKKNEFDEKYKIKCDELKSINDKKILKIKNELNDKYKSYIEHYEFNYNKNIFNNNINIDSNDMKEKNNLLLKETNELFESNKNKIEKEFDEKLNEDLSKYKIDIIQKTKIQQEQYKNELINLEQKYNEEMENFIKKQKEEKNENIYINESNKLNAKINMKYTAESISKGINELLNEIREIYDEEEIEDYFTEKNNELFFKLIKIKSFYDISEKDYMKYLCEIEYFKEILNLIIKNIFDNNNKNNIDDILLINDLIKKSTEIINKHKEKYKEEINKKLFPLLEKEFNKINNKKKEGYKYIKNIKNSFFEQSSKNAINTTIILDNFKNIVFNTNRNNKTKNNINIINNSSLNNFNKTFNKNISFTNRNPILSNNNISFLNKDKSNINSNNNNYINQNIQTHRSNYNNYNNNTLNTNSTTNKNDFTYVNMGSNDIKNIPYNDNSQIKQEQNINVNTNNNLNFNLEINNVQKINENIKNSLSQENKDICNEIQNFLHKEYNTLNEKISLLKNTNYIKNQLNSLRESAHLKKYRNIFSNIYEKEQKKSEDITNNIFKSKNNLDQVRKECNFFFNQINSGLITSENINTNFKNILNKINDYNFINKNANNHLRKSSSMDNKYINYRYDLNNNKIKKIKIHEESKEDDNNIKYTTFPLFCSSYRPNYLSDKINNNFSHNFFNFKKNYNDIKFSLISSNLI